MRTATEGTTRGRAIGRVNGWERWITTPPGGDGRWLVSQRDETSDPEADERSIEEGVRRAALLRHPGLARVVEGRNVGGNWRVAEEIGRARPLAARDARLPRGETRAEELRRLLEAIAYLHQQGLAHGSVSPESVFSDGKHLLLTGTALDLIGQGASSADVRAWADLTLELLEDVPSGSVTDAVRAAALDVRSAGSSAGAEQVLRRINDALETPHAAGGAAGDGEDNTERSAVMKALLASLHFIGSVVVGLFTMVLTMAVIGAAVAGGVLWFLDQLPAEVPVPGVVGMEREAARERLETANLQVGRVRSVYREDVDPGHVAETVPPSGMMVREGREVTLVVSMGAARVEVPRLIGLRPDEAGNLLDEKALQLKEGGKIRSNMPEGEIVEQDPPPGRKIAQGQRVLVKTSGGPEFGLVEVSGEREDDEPQRMLFRRIEIVVPRGGALQRVEVHEGHGDDLQKTYDRLHRPGDRIKLDIHGRPGTRVQVLVDGDMVFKTTLQV